MRMQEERENETHSGVKMSSSDVIEICKFNCSSIMTHNLK